MPKFKPDKPLTKKRLEKLLDKASTPISEWRHGQSRRGKSAARPSDGYSGKHKNPDKTEGKEG